ncbi:nucleotide pyrophosphohydrolase [Streptococcus iniae]|uniref:MazG nucleotide pyrophosphohydrolase domain-containing protein n=1 Tax=Streptococcus iniae TaxID=1346 RepID=UPI0008DB02A3|nr:MazG nucleotide pyrophosphohydrolase domain-containing protein [Streptococcus iniae]OHX26409.1 nucleotide pyrophosphohydrolase [Streptococcus iniae]RLV28682.1 nucleotide pyrophosphohydrolase [Streptococcus iniae]
MTKLTVDNYTHYLEEVYQNHKGDFGLFLKLVEEVGEVAEMLTLSNEKQSKNSNINDDLGKELADVLHYTLAIAAINKIDMEKIILDKDKQASLKYKREYNLSDYLQSKGNHYDC